MITHKTRLLVLAVLAILVLAILAAGSFLDLDGDTKSLLSTILESVAVLLVLGGGVDATMVERRRRDPSRPAIRDDVRADEAGG